jgi:hypothetical protein
LVFKFSLEYTIWRVQDQEGTEFDRTNELLTYANDVNLLGENINIMKSMGVLLGTCKMVGLELNSGNAEYVFLYCHQNVEQNHNMKIVYKSSENVAIVQVLGNDSNEAKLHSCRY